MAYNEKYPAGTTVRIASLDRLQEFKQRWKYHHPLADEQLVFAGTTAKVLGVAMYHGGDQLYQLEDTPGTWHEEVLSPP